MSLTAQARVLGSLLFEPQLKSARGTDVEALLSFLGGGSTGQYLIDHASLDKAAKGPEIRFRPASFCQVSFTGSGMAGQKMLEAFAEYL